ncbi:MAG: histidinol dehydrogenase, partial [Methanosarcinaceae archaeon]|nr:histidinol dehydrogenase [Methanosarcinaceae archaeon]
MQKLLSRKAGLSDVEETVEAVLSDVRKKGDEALREYTKKFDRVELEKLEVSQEEIEKAVLEV